MIYSTNEAKTTCRGLGRHPQEHPGKEGRPVTDVKTVLLPMHCSLSHFPSFPSKMGGESGKQMPTPHGSQGARTRADTYWSPGLQTIAGSSKFIGVFPGFFRTSGNPVVTALE